MTISAKIIADSISSDGVRITTFELEYPRFIHAEFMTHRLFSRNAASSRAIPVKDSIELIEKNTAMPTHWGKNQPGMSAKEECHENLLRVLDLGSEMPFPHVDRLHGWNIARDNAIYMARKFNEAGYHKQIVNRLLEPFSHIKVVLTATEYTNFFWLRNHPDAQPEIQQLAKKMHAAQKKSRPFRLNEGEWHVPYFQEGRWKSEEINKHSLSDALAISSSCCAQVSYRTLDDSIDKAHRIFQKLIESKPAHASPMEHQATPMNDLYETNWCQVAPEYFGGVTHRSFMDNSLWSANFRGWVQHRQLLSDHVKW